MFLVGAVLCIGSPIFVGPIGAALPLLPLRFQRIFLNLFAALGAFRNNSFLDLVIDLIPQHLVMTFDTCSLRERTVTLHNVFRKYTSIGLNVVNILGVVGKQLPLILEQPNEPMSRRVLLFGREYIFRN